MTTAEPKHPGHRLTEPQLRALGEARRALADEAAGAQPPGLTISETPYYWLERYRDAARLIAEAFPEETS